MPELSDRMAHLFDELKRRRVLRVAALYLVAAWAAIQVSDVTFPRLGFPDWTVTFVIVFLALMFPVAIGLAWVFDLTRTGVQRRPHGAPPSESQPPARVRARVPVALGSVTAVLLIAFGLWWASGDARASGLDTQLVAVTPFRVAGASPELAYLREGLMDLVAARIGGVAGEVRVVPPRTMSRHIREELGSLDADPETEQALDLAESLGAGRLLEGEVVGAGSSITVAATLYDVLTREVMLTRTLPVSSPDSLHSVVDAIATQLIAAESGLRTDRLAAITTRSMPALRAFLDAEYAFRRGQHARAVRAYDHAVTLDTTFTLAALGLMRSRGWAIGVTPETSGQLARAIVRRGIDRLGEADRAFAEVFIRRPGSTHRQRIQEALAAAERLPEQTDLQYLAGDRLLHYGTAVGIEDALERGRRQLETVVRMDSTYAEPLIHLYELAIARADTAGMLRYGALLFAIDSTGPFGTKVRYVRGEGIDGTRGAPQVDVDTMSMSSLDAIAHLGWGQATPPAVIEGFLRHYETATLPEEVRNLSGRVESAGVRGGQPSLVQLVERRAVENNPWSDASFLVRALYWLRDPEATRAPATVMRARLAELRSGLEAGDTTPTPPPVLVRECLLGHFAVAEGDVTEAGSRAQTLEREAAQREEDWASSEARTCALYLRAAIAVHGNRPDAAQRVQALDAHLATGPDLEEFIAPLYTLAVARLWETIGQRERALVALRRRMYTPFAAYWANELNGEQARIADALGRREEAIRAYRAYLSFMTNPEPPFDAHARQAQARLEVLLGDAR